MNIPENFDRWMFDYKEGNLSGAEKEAFENFLIQNPKFEIEADAWSDSYIQNEEFVYPNASELEKENKLIAGWYGYAAAAIALLLIGTSVIYLNRSNIEVNGFTASGHEVEVDDLNYASTNSAHETNHADLIDTYTDNVANEEVNIVNHNNNGGDDLANTGNDQNNNGSLNDNNDNLQLGNDLSNDLFNNDPNFVDPNDHSNPNFNNGNELEIDPDLNFSMNPTANQYSMDQEYAKYEEIDHTSKYQGNPEDSEMNFDVADIKINSGMPKINRFKKAIRKIEKMFSYPPALTNLRDPEYLIPNNSIVASNPGFAGGMLRPRTELNYRNQWLGNDQNSQQMTLSFDNYFYSLRGGVGVVINAKDYKYGQYGDYSVSLLYSPKIVVGKKLVFEPAVKITMGALTANGSKLAPESSMEIDRGRILNTPASQQMNGNQQLWYKDYGLGFVLNADKFYVGFSADNLNKHYENVYNEEGYATPTSTPVLYNGIVGFDYLSNSKNFSLRSFVAYQKLGSRQEFWAGTSCRMNKFIIGGSVSHKLDFTASIGLKFEKFKIAYQYDQTKTALTSESLGSHNLTLRFSGKVKKPRLK